MTARQMKITGGGRAHYTRVNSLKPQGVVRITQLSHMNVVLKKEEEDIMRGFFLISCIFNRICNSEPWTATINKMKKKINLFFVRFSPKLNHKEGAGFIFFFLSLFTLS